MILIALPCGRDAIISAVDEQRVRRHSWSANEHNASGKPYVRTTINKRTVYLHRFIVEPPKTYKVDHENGDTLDCRRPNLRIATFYENNINRGSWSISDFKGVSRQGRRFRARITINGEEFVIGRYDKESEAAIAYDDRAHKMWGEFARLNFPDRYPLPDHDRPKVEIPF